MASRRSFASVLLGALGILLVVSLAACDDDPAAPAAPAGMIAIDLTPDDIDFPWSLSLDGEALTEGVGDTLLDGMAPGAYAITWGDLDGWRTPAGGEEILAAGDTVTFAAAYDERLPFPSTPEQLVANFKTAYEKMDLEDYLDLLHPDYLMILQQATIDEFFLAGSTLDLTDETLIHTNLLGGAAGHDADGNLVTPVSYIVFAPPVQLTAWATTAEDHQIPSALTAMFDVSFDFYRAGDVTLKVQGQLKFFLSVEEEPFGDTVRPHYRLIGLWDFTENKSIAAIEEYCFGSVKALYR